MDKILEAVDENHFSDTYWALNFGDIRRLLAAACATFQLRGTVHVYQQRRPTSLKDSFCYARTQLHSGSYRGSQRRNHSAECG
jgi:hypothetical protein